ncbi:hypothetical protein HNO88_001427 [Novosphingobium chloroacetimidivorans]|uniref:Oligosaccharide repeat unit polymerase n=1 Tax=Novosphingobium chloroacetimidivorans TaxID=1428314 RepID=A0A7W7NV20_9SPHN|nr:hypothetical protein [Novosphingobium chloroacetimidivorans]MBB4858113.1 hypothetical protein [Novosphingobium chloroacetimidivorans]
MMHLILWTLYLGGVAINLHMFARIDLSRLDFLDGILIGQGYYVIVPLGVFLATGQAEVPDLHLVYRPYGDLATTGMLIGGMYLFPALRTAFGRVHPERPDRSDPRMVSTVVMLFIVTGAVSFMLTGLASGGHWQENVDGAFANPAFLPIKYAANVARNAVFAVLLYRVTRGEMTIGLALLAGLMLALIDLFTTFNRITAVYLLIMAMLLMKRMPVRLILVAAGSLVGLSAFSTVWPAFRGLATTQGYSAASFAEAWNTARRAQEMSSASLDASLNGVFESSNIVVLNWIVQHYGAVERPFLSFAMFARPVTLLLPGAVWPGRPENFGLSLGEGIAHMPSLALNSTLYGESFANFGWFWPLGLCAFVLLWHGVYRAIAPNARVVQTMGAFAAIAMWRFDASFVGCAALLTGALVCALWLIRVSRLKSVGHFYFLSAASVVSAGFLAGQIR